MELAATPIQTGYNSSSPNANFTWFVSEQGFQPMCSFTSRDFRTNFSVFILNSFSRCTRYWWRYFSHDTFTAKLPSVSKSYGQWLIQQMVDLLVGIFCCRRMLREFSRRDGNFKQDGTWTLSTPRFKEIARIMLPFNHFQQPLRSISPGHPVS